VNNNSRCNGNSNKDGGGNNDDDHDHDDDDHGDERADTKKCNADVVSRYTADYSKWNDWIPTDDASKSEIGK